MRRKYVKLRPSRILFTALHAYAFKQIMLAKATFPTLEAIKSEPSTNRTIVNLRFCGSVSFPLRTNILFRIRVRLRVCVRICSLFLPMACVLGRSLDRCAWTWGPKLVAFGLDS